jgi:dephospho-CoA kinase
MFVLGITGNSGSGKGVASDVLREMGAVVVDCDKIAHRNMQKGGPVYEDLLNLFGGIILGDDGEIERRLLAKIVFNDDAALCRLNAVTHSKIKEEVKGVLNENKDTDRVVVIDAPLLIESGMMPMVDKIWLIRADKDIRIERIKARDNLTTEAALDRIKKETDADRLAEYSDEVIYHNDNDIEQFKNKIREFAKQKGLFNDKTN